MQELEDFRRHNIERVQSTPLVKDILAGKPDKEHYMGYLINVYNYAKHSPTVISLAASRCVQTHPELGRYLFRHAEEEIGHEFWALSDLKDFGLAEPQIKAMRPTAACTSMIAIEYYVAGTWNPVALFGWLYALESLGDAMGTMISQCLGKGLALEGQAVYFLQRTWGSRSSSHQRPSGADYPTCHGPQDLDDIFYIAEVSSGLYAQMIEEVSTREPSWLLKPA